MNTLRQNGLSQPPLGLLFFMVTTTFILLADLIPKRLALIDPEGIALRTIGIMQAFYFPLKTYCMVF